MSSAITPAADGGALPASGAERARDDQRGTAADPSAEQATLAAEVPRVDHVLEGLIYLFIAYLPLAFGGVMPASQVVIVAATALLAGVFAVRCIAEPHAPVVLSKAFIPLFALVGVVLVQLAPLPAGVLELVSPGSAAAWKELATARGLEFDGGTISLYPRGTRADLTVLLAGVVLVVVGATLFRRRASFRRLLACVALVALVVALIGLAQIVGGADHVYWYFNAPGMITSGPFAHYGHYSEFLNLGIGCALGFLLIRTAARGRSPVVDIQAVMDQRGAGLGLERALLAFIVIGAIAIVMSTSRNGLMSMVVGAGVSAALMQLSRRVEGIGWPMVIAAALALAGLLTLGIDPVIRRLEDTFADPVDAFSTRADLLRDTVAMFAAFPLLGAGLGTYWVAFPAFDTSVRGGTAEHAENQYIETFAELGALGGVLVFAFVGLVLWGLVRSLMDTSHRTNFGLFGVTFGFAAIAFHSLTDFGMEIPAVGLTVALLAGATIARSQGKPRVTTRVRMTTAALSAGTGIALLGGLAPAFAAADAHHASLLAEYQRDQIHTGAVEGDAGAHAALVSYAASAAESDPGNVEFRFLAAFDRWTEAVAGARGFDPDAPAVTPETNPELVPLARETVDELLAAAVLAPTHGPTWAVAGQLRTLWLDRDGSDDPSTASGPTPGGDWILRGRALAPHDPNTCLAAAFEHFRRGDDDTGLAELDRAIAVGIRAERVVLLLAVDLDSPEFAARFVEGDLGLTDRLLRAIEKDQRHAALAAELQESMVELLVAACARSSADPWQLSRLARIQQDRDKLDSARDLYRRLLGRDPVSRDRYHYARLLLEEGAERDARRELRDLLTYHPDHAPGRRLLDQLERGAPR